MFKLKWSWKIANLWSQPSDWQEAFDADSSLVEKIRANLAFITSGCSGYWLQPVVMQCKNLLLYNESTNTKFYNGTDIRLDWLVMVTLITLGFFCSWKLLGITELDFLQWNRSISSTFPNWQLEKCLTVFPTNWQQTLNLSLFCPVQVGGACRRPSSIRLHYSMDIEKSGLILDLVNHISRPIITMNTV